MVSIARLGIVQRFAIHLFDNLGSLERKRDFQVAVSFLELYNDDIKDLLAPHSSSSSKSYPRLRQNAYGIIDVDGVHQEHAHNSEELLR